MLANISQSGRPQSRITDRMEQHIGIRMSHEATVKRDQHATNHQRASGHQRVHVPAFTDPQVYRRSIVGVDAVPAATDVIVQL